MQKEIEKNRIEYQNEKEAREKRLMAYTDLIQKKTLEKSAKIIAELVEERHKQGMTQQDWADITGILSCNLARFESGTRIPTLLVLQKYASALGKNIELVLADREE